jgi:cysteinyl-tRNA synthetase
MLVSKKEQASFNKDMLKDSKSNLARLKAIYDNLVETDKDGRIRLRPGASLEDVALFKAKLLEIANTYTSMQKDLDDFAKEAEVVDKKSQETKDNLVAFCKTRNYTIPQIFKDLYGIKD